MAEDLRFAWRSLRKAPGLINFVVLTLALGVGVNCAVFSLAWAALLRPLPYPNASRLVWVSATDMRRHLSLQPAVSPDQLNDWRSDLHQLFARYTWVSRGGVGEPYRVNGFARTPMVRSASAELFSMLGVRPVLGRLSLTSQSVVLSNAFWREAYASDPQVVGKTIAAIDSAQPYTIAGVLPASFRLNQPTDLWFLSTPYPGLHNDPLYQLIGVRRPGVSVSAVQSRITALERRNPLNVANIQRPPELSFQAVSLRDLLSGPWREPLFQLLAAAACLLLLACINIANLLLARSRQREAELAMRLTLGCPPARLARQILFESALLAAAGGLAGWLAVAVVRGLAAWGNAVLPPSIAAPLAQLHVRGVDPVVIGFALLAALVTLFLFGLAPALRSARASLQPRLQTRARRIGRAPHLLVAAEAALAVVLVLSAALLLRSFANLATTNPGFQSRRVISFDLYLPFPKGRHAHAAYTADHAYLHRLLLRLRNLPGVAAAAGTNGLPLSDPDAADFAVTPARFEHVFPATVTPGYFATLGIPIRAGRGFSPSDQPGQPKKLIVNQAFADTYFPGQHVLGRVLQLPRCEKGFLANPQSGCTVIGVAGNVRGETLAIPPQPAAYISQTQESSAGYTFVLRTKASPAVVLPELRRLLKTLPPAPGQRPPFVFAPRTLDSTVSASLATPRFRGWLAGLLAALALALAAIGIYGVESHAVSRRVHEIGIRVALGAGRSNIRNWVLAEALGWTLLGAAIGLPLALVASRLLAHFLYQVPRWDPVSAAAAPLLLILIALVAAWRPARRATSVNPIEVLRSE